MWFQRIDRKCIDIARIDAVDGRRTTSNVSVKSFQKKVLLPPRLFFAKAGERLIFSLTHFALARSCVANTADRKSGMPAWIICLCVSPCLLVSRITRTYQTMYVQ